MKVILFGGAEINLGQFLPQLKLIERVIKEINPKQILLVPFARSKVFEKEWEGDWLNENVDLGNIAYLNAENEEEIKIANNPLIFINGGGENKNLLEKINSNPRLLELIKNAEYVIGESAGAMVLGKYLREKGGDKESELIEGLDIIKDTIIEPHYSERNRKTLLKEEIEKTGVFCGIGIDCMTAIEFNLDEFPKNYKKIGNGLVEIIKQKRN